MFDIFRHFFDIFLSTLIITHTFKGSGLIFILMSLLTLKNWAIDMLCDPLTLLYPICKVEERGAWDAIHRFRPPSR